MQALKTTFSNLYIDKEITGELLIVPYKRYNQYILKSIPENGNLSKIARQICKIAGYFLTGPFALAGMCIKYFHANQVRDYNEKIRQHIKERKVLIEYPNQPDTQYLLPINDLGNYDERNVVFERINACDKVYKRCVCNILGYPGNNQIVIQFIEESPRWQIPEGVVRPFEA